MEQPEELWAKRVAAVWHDRRNGAGLESIGQSDAADRLAKAGLRKRARDEAEFATAMEALDRAKSGEPLDTDHAFALESIVQPDNRPVIDIVHGTYTDVPEHWSVLSEPEVRGKVERAIASVGRLDIDGHPGLAYGGTAFCVGDGLMMTNRHVAEIFANGLGRTGITFKPGQGSRVDLRQEVIASPEQHKLAVTRVVMIHPYWDCAIVEVTGADHLQPLRLLEREPQDLADRLVVIVGYPALDPRDDIDLQQRIFRVFEKKRLQPGQLISLDHVQSFGEEVVALTHDISTLGGNSGSAVIDMYTGDVLGLHFQGKRRVANYAVPAWELARDYRVADVGVTFVHPPARTLEVPWDDKWRALEGSGQANGGSANRMS